MSIRTQSQLEVSQAKLGFLQGACKALGVQPGFDAHVDEMARQSLENQIRQLQREIAQFQSGSGRHVAVF